MNRQIRAMAKGELPIIPLKKALQGYTKSFEVMIVDKVDPLQQLRRESPLHIY